MKRKHFSHEAINKQTKRIINQIRTIALLLSISSRSFVLEGFRTIARYTKDQSINCEITTDT